MKKALIISALIAPILTGCFTQGPAPYYDVGIQFIGGPCNEQLAEYRFAPVGFDNPKIGDMKMTEVVFMTDTQCGISKGDKMRGTVEIVGFRETSWLQPTKIPTVKYKWDQMFVAFEEKTTSDYFDDFVITKAPFNF